MEKRKGELCFVTKSTIVTDACTWRHLSFGKFAAIYFLLVLIVIVYDVSYMYKYSNENSNKGVNNKFKIIKETPQCKLQVENKQHRLPKCILIGVAKGGTRALIEFLDHLHPDIVAYIGEVKFFDQENRYCKGLDFYRSLMPLSFANQITIEKTPAYFNTVKVPHRVHQMNSSIKLLLTVRDPVKRIVSEYTMRRNMKVQKLSFRAELFDDHGAVNIKSVYVKRSIYHEHFTRWLQHFPREQIHIVDGEKFVNDPYDELFKIETFLRIGHKISNKSIQLNTKKGFYCMDIRNATNCLDREKGLEHVHVPETQLEKLRKYFTPLNERFFEVAGIRFNWK